MIATLIKKLLPPEEQYFFHSFEMIIEICESAALNLLDILNTGYSDDKIKKAKECKRSSAKIVNETLEKLNNSFVTPIDREDIQHITNGMHKINRRICRACVNIKLFQIKEFDERIVKQAEILKEAVDGLRAMMEMLKKHTKVSEFVSLRERIDDVESKGDEIFSIVIEDLFSGRYDAIDVIKLRDIHNCIETALNTSVVVAEDVVQIVLKHN